MACFTQFYGIDVSKDTLDFVQLNAESQFVQEGHLTNSLSSIQNWLNSLSKDQTFCVLEATGTYSAKLSYCLDKANIRFAVVNPMKSKAFMDVLGLHNKTDRLAAWSLALMGCQLELKPYSMPSINQQQRRQIHQALQALQKQQRMLKNQLHALKQLPIINPVALQAYKTTLETINGQITQLEQQLDDLADEEEHQQLKKRICSIVGIGQRTADAILLTVNDLSTFETASQLSRFLGLTPGSHYSGSSVRRKGRISKQGSHWVRSLLYMCTRSAIRYNLACQELYQRLRSKGKPHKVAAVAVMHKLIKQVFACVKKEVMFDNQFELKRN